MDLLYKEKVVYKALEELDRRFSEIGVLPFELNVVGGFAMTVQQIRMSDYTDIDYIGAPLPTQLREIVDEIGLRFGLGRGWVNSDVLLAGNTLDDLELLTGHLEFKRAFDLSVIKANVLNKKCLLRMKVIAVDTAFAEVEIGGQFARFKDFEDISLLMESMKYSMDDLTSETSDYVMSPDIFHLNLFCPDHSNTSCQINYSVTSLKRFK
jgi:hypothetical protein